MTKIDPIIAVKDVETSSKWYQTIFGCKSMHGGDEFDILVNDETEILCCLRKWGEPTYPTMINSDITPGNGLILYFRTANLKLVYQNVIDTGWQVEQNIHINKNTKRQEFSIRDPDGYFLTITEFHKYEG